MQTPLSVFSVFFAAIPTAFSRLKHKVLEDAERKPLCPSKLCASNPGSWKARTGSRRNGRVPLCATRSEVPDPLPIAPPPDGCDRKWRSVEGGFGVIPVGVPTLIGAGDAQAQHRLGVVLLPPAAGQFEPLLDHMPVAAFHFTRAYGQPRRARARVVGMGQRPRSNCISQRSSADGVKDAGETGARTAPPDARAGSAVSVTGSAALRHTTPYCARKLPAEGTRWGEAASGNYWRSERTICVVCVRGKQGAATGAQRGTSEHRQPRRSVMPTRRTKRSGRPAVLFAGGRVA